MGENGGVTTAYPHAKEWRWVSTSCHIQRLTQDESRDPKVRAKTVKFLGENTGINPNDQETWGKTDKLNYIKL